MPALHRARLRGRDDRPVAAVAEGAPDGRRPAPDQQRRRHHQLRDAARPASRCTPSTSTASPAGGSSCAARSDGEQVDHARRPGAHARRRDARHRRRRRPDVDRRRHGRRALRGPRRTRRACCWRSPPGTGRTSTAPRSGSACAARPRRASRRASRPSRRWRPQAVATRLMLELTRRAARARARSTSAAPGRRRAVDPPARARASSALLGMRDPARARRPRSCARSSFGVAERRRRPRRHGARTSGATTSRARPTSSRRSRASTALEKLPATLPARARRAPGALTHEPARCAAAPRTRSSAAGCYEIVGWSFTEPGAADRLRLRAGRPAPRASSCSRTR